MAPKEQMSTAQILPLHRSNAEVSWNQLRPVVVKQEHGQTVTGLFHQQLLFLPFGLG